MARSISGQLPGPQGQGKPTKQVGFSERFVSPYNAQGESKSWPTVNADLSKIRQPANPLGIKHNGTVNKSYKDNKEK